LVDFEVLMAEHFIGGKDQVEPVLPNIVGTTGKTLVGDCVSFVDARHFIRLGIYIRNQCGADKGSVVYGGKSDEW